MVKKNGGFQFDDPGFSAENVRAARTLETQEVSTRATNPILGERTPTHLPNSTDADELPDEEGYEQSHINGTSVETYTEQPETSIQRAEEIERFVDSPLTPDAIEAIADAIQIAIMEELIAKTNNFIGGAATQYDNDEKEEKSYNAAVLAVSPLFTPPINHDDNKFRTAISTVEGYFHGQVEEISKDILDQNAFNKSLAKTLVARNSKYADPKYQQPLSLREYTEHVATFAKNLEWNTAEAEEAFEGVMHDAVLAGAEAIGLEQLPLDMPYVAMQEHKKIR